MAANISETAWNEMVNMIRELEEQVRKQKEPTVGYLTNKKSFQNFPKYSGKPDAYEQWKFKFCNFLYEEPGWIAIVQLLDRMLTTPTAEELTSFRDNLVKSNIPGITSTGDLTMKSHQLYLCLCSALEGPSLTSIQNLEVNEDFVGFRAWLKVAHECTHMSSQRVQSLVVRIHQPKRVKRYCEVNPAIDSWEHDLKNYELHERTTLADAMKVYALRQIVPEELDRDIYKNNSLTDYESTKNYVQTQVNIRRDLPKNGVVPMEVDAAYRADVEARRAMLANMSWGTSKYDEKQCDHDHGQGDHKGADDTPEQETDAEKSINALFELVKIGGDTAIHAAQALSMVKGGGNGKGSQKGGGKGKSWGKGFDGNCSHCGKYGHRLNECRIKDKEMEEWRASKGKSQGKGWDQGGKSWGKSGKGGSNYGGNYGKGGKGGYGGGGYGGGYGKGGANYMNNDWAASSAATSWAFSLEKGVPGQGDDAFKSATKTFSSTGKLISTFGPPPGLNSFEVLNNDAGEEDDEEVEQEYNSNFPGLLKNYSKGSVRRAINEYEKKTQPQEKKKKREYRKVNECFLFEKQPVQKELNALPSAAVPDDNGYIKITGVMDSGASESVAPTSMCPQYDVRPSPGSIAGQNYLSASNGVMYNVGEQVLDVVTNTGKESKVKYQIVDKVSRPLNSISEICDAGGPNGQHVIFGRTGGVILNLDTGDQTPFGRTEGIYTMDMWVKPREGFARRD